MRWFWMLLATFGLLGSSKARSHPDHASANGTDKNRPAERQQRRRARRRRDEARWSPAKSPCGRHEVAVAKGVVFIDGRRVHPSTGRVEITIEPTWRDDGDAVAWIERDRGETRLVVLPELVGPGAQAMEWPLPSALARDRVAWAGKSRVVVGPELLQPRAVASWTE